MSRTIDSRIVEIQFDNRQFESNVKTSMSTLDKLKQSLNLTEASKGLENVGTAANNVNMSGLSGAVETVRMKFSALEVIAVTALANITTSAMRAGSSLLKNTIGAIAEGGKRRALNIEQAKFQFKGLGMDVEATMADASYAVDGTAFSLDAAAKVASQLGASGMRAGDDMRKSLRAVSGVAAMAGSSYEDIGNVFTKVAGQGRLMGDDLLRLSSRGINAAATIAKELNITEAEVRAMVTKGEVDFQTFANAMDSAFGEHATAANETFTGSLSNVKAALGRIGENIYGPLHKNMIAPLNELRLKINEVAKILEPVFAKLAILMEKAGKKATEMLKNLDLTEVINKFKMGEGTADKLRRTFAGLFAIVDMGVSVFKLVTLSVGELFKKLAPVGSKILDTTARFGDFMVSVRDGATASEAFAIALEKVKTAIDKVKTFMATVADGIGTAIDKISEYFGQFSGIDLGPLSIFSGEVEAQFKPFTFIGEVISTTFEIIKDVLTKASPYFEAFKESVSGTFEKLGFENFADVVQSLADGGAMVLLIALINGIKTALVALLESGAVTGLITIVKNIGTTIKKAGGFVDSTKNILDGVGDALQAFQSKLKSEALLNIAIAIGILAAALWVLSTIPEAELMTALQGISILFVEIGVVMSAVSKMNPGAGAVKMAAMSSQMMTMAFAILILSAALKSLAELEWDEMIRGVAGVAALSLILVKTAEALGKASGKMVSGGMGLIFFATGLLILVQSVKQLSSLGWEELTKGLSGVGILLSELVMFAKFMGDGKGMMKIGFALIPMATGLLILSQSVKSLAGLSWEELLKGLGGVGILLLELAMFAKLMGDGKGIMKVGLAMIPLAVGIFILAQAVKQLSGLSWEEMLKGLTGIAGILAILAGVSKIISPGNLLAMGVALVGVGVALNLIAASMLIIGSMSWEDMLKSMLGLGGALLILAGAMTLMSGGLAGAVALTAIALALALLVPSLVVLGMMDLKNIGMMLLALVGVFAVFAIAGLALGPLTPVLLSLAGAITLLGVGVLALGAGLTLATAAMAAFVAGGAAYSIVFVNFIKKLIKLIPFVIEQLGKALVILLDSLILAMPLIFKTLGLLLDGIIDLLIEYIPPIMEVIGVILSEVFELLLEYVPEFVELIVTLLINILDLLAEHVDDVVVAALNLIVGFVEGLIEGIPMVVEAIVRLLGVLIEEIGEFIPELITMGFDLMISFMDSMAEKLDEKIPELIDSAKLMIEKVVDGIVYALETGIPWIKEQIGKVAEAMWTAFKEFFGINSPSTLFEDGAGDIIQGLINGLLNGITSVGQAIKDVAESVWSNFKSFFGINSPSTLMTEGAGFIIQGIVNGLGNGILDVGTKALEVGAEVFSKIKDGIGDISEVAGNVVDGLSTGIQNGVSKIGNAAKSLGSSIVGGLKEVLNINSPSKVAEDIAEFTGEGLIIGLNNMSLATEKAAEGLGDSAIDGMTKSLANIGDCIDEDMDLTPTIRPVVDMSDVDKNISDTFSQQRSLDVSSTLSKASSTASDVKSSTDVKAEADGSITNEGDTNSVVINQYNTVRSNDDVDKINSGLTRLINKISRAKGVIPL